MKKCRLTGYRPGAMGRVIQLHAEWYHRHWDFGLFFEAKVAAELAGFLSRFETVRDFFRVAELEGEIIGSVAIVGGTGTSDSARLRWFIVHPGHQGRGIGNLLIGEALDFCRSAGFGKVSLSTFAGLDAARHLYEKHGFVLVGEREGDRWGKMVTEQDFELLL